GVGLDAGGSTPAEGARLRRAGWGRGGWVAPCDGVAPCDDGWVAPLGDAEGEAGGGGTPGGSGGGGGWVAPGSWVAPGEGGNSPRSSVGKSSGAKVRCPVARRPRGLISGSKSSSVLGPPTGGGGGGGTGGPE